MRLTPILGNNIESAALPDFNTSFALTLLGSIAWHEICQRNQMMFQQAIDHMT